MFWFARMRDAKSPGGVNALRRGSGLIDYPILITVRP
jgi:hypothetical protein